MAAIVVLLIIGLVCWGLAALLQSASNSMQEKAQRQHDAQVRDASNALDSVYNELYGELKRKYDECIQRPEYKKTGFPTVTTDTISLYFGDIDSGYNDQKFDLWKNDENLCCVSNWKYLDELANAAKSVTAKYSLNESPYQREQTLRTKFTWKHTQVQAFYIPLNNIEYFSMGGQKYATTEITGGGAVGGSSLTGAIAGGIVAGGAGAVIGSRKESTINPVQAQTIVHDETETYIKYKDQDGTLKEVVSKRKADSFFNALKKVIPEKEYAYILSQNQAQPQQVIEEKNSIEDRLVKAKELLEKGLITQEEYEVKRKDILSEM